MRTKYKHPLGPLMPILSAYSAPLVTVIG